MTLHDYKEQLKGKIDEKSLSKITNVLVKFYLDESKNFIRHCDIKPSNIVLDTKWVSKKNVKH